MREIDTLKTREETPPKYFLGKRYIQFFMCFLALLIGYGMRTNMSVGIIAMMDKNPSNPTIPTYPEWTKKNIILSSFFWGYIIPQIGAGQLAKKFGPKWFLIGTMFINSLFSILIPLMAEKFGENGVLSCRIIQGLNQGFFFPSVHTLLGKWTPVGERSRVASFVYTGGPLGTVISMPLTGIISDSQAGWPWAFYLYGGMGIIWVILWYIFGANTPNEYKSITLWEKHYIEESLQCDKSDIKKQISTPWMEICTSLPMWAILISHCGQNWGFWTLVTEIPSYMNKILGYDLAQNSSLSALPYLALWILNFIFSQIADWLINRKYISLTNSRKLFNSIGLIIPAGALFWLGFIDKSQKILALSLLTIAVGFNAAVFSGYNVNHIDLSPNHAGTLMGITNSLSNIVSILAPLALVATGRNEDDPILWQIIFCLAGGIYILTDIFYIIFASGQVQYWNSDDYKKRNRNREEIFSNDLIYNINMKI